jgi:hypothetical protein
MLIGKSIRIARVTIKAWREVQPRSPATGSKKFMPKKPVMKVMGMNRVVMMVRLYMTSFMRLLITER